jgi:hypothetical protein
MIEGILEDVGVLSVSGILLQGEFYSVNERGKVVLLVAIDHNL